MERGQRWKAAGGSRVMAVEEGRVFEEVVSVRLLLLVTYRMRQVVVTWRS